MNYFVGVLLDASKNKDNKMEYTEKNGVCYVRTGGFNAKWDFSKAKAMPCNVHSFLSGVKVAKKEMRELGLSVPGVFTKHHNKKRK